jgi:hypothetical protein
VVTATKQSMALAGWTCRSRPQSLALLRLLRVTSGIASRYTPWPTVAAHRIGVAANRAAPRVVRAYGTAWYVLVRTRCAVVSISCGSFQRIARACEPALLEADHFGAALMRIEPAGHISIGNVQYRDPYRADAVPSDSILSPGTSRRARMTSPRTLLTRTAWKPDVAYLSVVIEPARRWASKMLWSSWALARRTSDCCPFCLGSKSRMIRVVWVASVVRSRSSRASGGQFIVRTPDIEVGAPGLLRCPGRDVTTIRVCGCGTHVWATLVELQAERSGLFATAYNWRFPLRHPALICGPEFRVVDLSAVTRDTEYRIALRRLDMTLHSFGR